MTSEELKQVLAKYSTQELYKMINEMKKPSKNFVNKEVVHKYTCSCCGWVDNVTYICETNSSINVLEFDVRTCDKCLPRLAQDFDNVEECLMYMLDYIRRN